MSSKKSDNFSIYGRNLGLAFQMIDDILDITEDSAKLGKPSMLDFVEGKVTIPYLLLWDRINDGDKLILQSLYKKALTHDELEWIKSKMNETSVVMDSIKMARKYGLEAIEAIKDEQNEELVLIMTSMIERDF